MTAASRPHYTLEEYVRLEARANNKHEYLDGEILAMAGGTPEHAAIASAIIIALGNALRGRPCRVYTSDARVRVVATGLDTYPDVTVVCGAEERDRDDRLALTNPILLVEVTSESSEGYHRGAKLDHYKKIPSLRAVLVVAHDRKSVDVHVRAEETSAWSERAVVDRIDLSPLGFALDVAELYPPPLA